MSATLPLPIASEAANVEHAGTFTSVLTNLRSLKITCGLVLAIAFWFAVPYSLPLRLSPDHAIAAAQEAAAYQGSLSRELALPVVLGVSALMLWRLPRLGRIAYGSKLAWAVFGYAAWSMASIAWSSDRQLTGKRLVVFAICLVFAYVLAHTATVMEIALFGVCCTGTVAAISLLCDTLITGSFAPFDPNYRFMGVMTANFQAMNLVACLLCALAIAVRRPTSLRWLSPFMGCAALLLFLTRARAGSFLCLAMFLAAGWLVAKRKLTAQTRRGLLWGALAVGLLVPVLASVPGSRKLITSMFMMGRKDTQNTASLSNRAPLWAELFGEVKQHPLTGFGYGAFWTSDRVKAISLRQGWTVPHAHNTYLDETLSLGLIGAGLYGCMVVGACWTAWRRYRTRADDCALLPALFLTWLMLLSCSESIPIAPNLPTLIAYAFLLKMCLIENPEAVNSRAQGGSFSGSDEASHVLKNSFREGRAV